jgi:accessory gene regulator protein AgrB
LLLIVTFFYLFFNEKYNFYYLNLAAIIKYLSVYFYADINVENGIFIFNKLQSIELFDKWKDVLPFYKNVKMGGTRIYR